MQSGVENKDENTFKSSQVDLVFYFYHVYCLASACSVPFVQCCYAPLPLSKRIFAKSPHTFFIFHQADVFQGADLHVFMVLICL